MAYFEVMVLVDTSLSDTLDRHSGGRGLLSTSSLSLSLRPFRPPRTSFDFLLDFLSAFFVSHVILSALIWKSQMSFCSLLSWQPTVIVHEDIGSVERTTAYPVPKMRLKDHHSSRILGAGGGGAK
jgi:hypothetical protein